MVLGTMENGTRVYYTGRAGSGWVSVDQNEAFVYESIDAARRKAMIFNRMTLIHGIRFMAPSGYEDRLIDEAKGPDYDDGWYDPES